MTLTQIITTMAKNLDANNKIDLNRYRNSPLWNVIGKQKRNTKPPLAR